ncbi:efflux RND transporter periplasmic adaptor subunit [Paremcibacter congregatus]|uniref:Uncharacterized protein n=1 Tax=Paremcibacter congregatus TaxID=2043170 RepID=A0A2G4YRP1_9PROT|nr:efflux RND transporter periplasmic adaptor subunit [Paremcibacter congregatus]PHZ84126.1 hypothetical protein CRD36_13080 [Paremcibacter congregatus]QDE25813.1 efflux RND transporter periplasmic adaptor subunit [Paremcibacter congregatus]
MTQTPDPRDATANPTDKTGAARARPARMKIIIGGVLLLTIAGAVLYTRSSAQANLDEEQTRLARALMVETSQIKAQDHYQIHQKYSGRIVAGRESDHGFDKGGLLAEVLVDEGQRVKKGDSLARLDMRRLEARLGELDAELSQSIALDHQAGAQLDRAQATYDRYKVLRQQSHISAEKFDQVKFDLAGRKAQKTAAESAILRTKAALKSLRVDQALATLTARFDGSVVRRYQDEGTALGAGAPVIRLIEDEKLEIHLGLPEAAVAKLSPGDIHVFQQNGTRLTARLRATHARLDPATRTVTALFDILETSAPVHAGSLAQLTLAHEVPANGFWLPSDALAESRRGLWSVYTVTPAKGNHGATHGTVARQELQLLYTDSERVFVRGTLQDGDRIVTGGLHRLVPGQMVKLAKGQ